METQVCNICKKVLPIEEFVRNHMYRNTGYTKRCKPCARRYEKIKKENEDNPNISPLDYCNDPDAKRDAEVVLRGLGYELYNPDNPVWKQFEERIKNCYLK